MCKIKWLCCILILLLTACGGSSTTTESDSDSGSGSGSGTTASDTTAPTVSSVTTDDSGADTALSSTAGDDRVSGLANATAFFTITFSEAMDPETVIADNITLTCNSAAVTIGTPATSDNITWTVPVASDLTGYVACTLTLGVGLTDAAGNALAEAAAYAFNTQCSTDDTFTVDTLGFTDASNITGNCWNYANTGYPIPPSPSSTSFAVDTTIGQVLFTSPSGVISSTYQGLFKTFTSTSFTATLEIAGMSQGGGIGCYLDAHNASNPINGLIIKAATTSCKITINGTEGPAVTCPAETSNAQSPLFLQLSFDGAAAVGKFGSTSAVTDGTLQNPVGQTVNLGTEYLVGFWCESNTTGQIVRIGSFTIDTTASGPGTQY